MKMRAYLYQGKYKAVLECVDQIDALKKYGLFHSYATLFDPANEGNKEVLFDIPVSYTHLLGTQFNVCVYGDEPKASVVLVEGRVEVENDKHVKEVLAPNQMIELGNKGAVSYTHLDVYKRQRL